MKSISKLSLSILLALMPAASSLAQDTDKNQAKETDYNLIQAALKGWHVRVGAGVSVGGMSPLPLPVEIRSIDSYKPTLCIALEGAVEKRFQGSHWGMMLGVRFENKGMKTDATVKNYHMEAVNASSTGAKTKDNKVVGAWTGHVRTEVHNNYLTFPVLATYSFNDRWMIKAGPYLSWMFNGSFSGAAYARQVGVNADGEPVYDEAYIRDQNPTGEKSQVERATYDFSEDLRHFQWGVQLGGEFKAFKHLSVSADLCWGLNGIFPSDFESVTFPLFPIYGTLGFHYLF